MEKKAFYTYPELAMMYGIPQVRRFRHLLRPIQADINAISGTNSRKLVHRQVELIKKHLGEPPPQRI